MEHKCLHDDDLKELREKTDRSVSWSTLWAVVLVLVGIFGSLMNIMFSKISEQEIATNESKVTAAKIETQLTQIQTDILEIKLSLREHDRIDKK